MKFLVSNLKAVNLANVSDISVSSNHLMLTMTDGREVRFVYGTQSELETLFVAVMDFIISSNIKVFDCDKYLRRK